MFAFAEVTDDFNAAQNVTICISKDAGAGLNVYMTAINYEMGLSNQHIPVSAHPCITTCDFIVRHAEKVNQDRPALAVEGYTILIIALSYHVLGLKAGHGLHSLIPDNDFAFIVNNKNCIRHRIDDIGQPSLRRLQFVLKTFAFAYIADCLNGPCDLAVDITKNGGTGLKPDSKPRAITFTDNSIP